MPGMDKIGNFIRQIPRARKGQNKGNFCSQNNQCRKGQDLPRKSRAVPPPPAALEIPARNLMAKYLTIAKHRLY